MGKVRESDWAAGQRRMALTGPIAEGTGRALPAAEACGRCSHDSLCAGTLESNIISAWWGCLWVGWGGKFSCSRRQAGGSAWLGGCSQLWEAAAATPLWFALPFWKSHWGHRLLTIWITSFPYLCKLNGHMVRCIALQWDGSGGSAEDKSVALYFPASVRVASVGLCAYWISKAAAHVISWSSMIEQILDDWCTDVYFMVAKWAINQTYCMQWGLASLGSSDFCPEASHQSCY